jgi:hypothetical protein
MAILFVDVFTLLMNSINSFVKSLALESSYLSCVNVRDLLRVDVEALLQSC